jgi:hypothetical protein
MAATAEAPERGASLSEDVARFLALPATHADLPDHVEVRETHISRVFLTRRYAYKQKKPVHFEFVDYSTLALREKACREEVRLNRRLARDVYLGAVPVGRGANGKFVLGATPAIDWVVKMRRLPDGATLDCLLRRGGADRLQIEPLAVLLCEFYRQAPPVLLESDSYVQSIRRHVEANDADLSALLPARWAAVAHRVQGQQLRMLTLSPELFQDRVRDGRIVDGHGDLRPEHVYLLDSGPVVIDCLEFSSDLRRLDVADELAFLQMECERLGERRMGAALFEAYSLASGDRPAEQLCRFYKGYRATVRAKVAALRAGQLAGEEGSQALSLSASYLELARRELEGLMPPIVLVVGGLSGTGKSTVAAGVASVLGARHLSTDVIRRERFGPSTHQAGVGEERYSSDARNAVYEELIARAGRLVAEGQSVVLDGTFLEASHVQKALLVAAAHRALGVAVLCLCPRDVALARIRNRSGTAGNESEARQDVYESQHPLSPAERARVGMISIDTSESVPEAQRAVLDHCAGRARTAAGSAATSA